MLRNGIDEITFDDESLYVDFSQMSWWIDSGATANVANSMRGLIMIKITTQGTRRLQVGNEIEVGAEVMGFLTLELHTNYSLRLNNGLYVPTLSKNLVPISCWMMTCMNECLATKKKR